MIEKRSPHYPLVTIKAAFADPAGLNRTFSATLGAEALDMDESQVVTVIQNLAGPDFFKSMTSNANSEIWQDVYKPVSNGMKLYVKFTLNARNELLLISFKVA